MKKKKETSKKEMTNQCCVYDFRVSANLTTTDDLRQLLRKIAKKWAFQLERGDQTDYLHYQGRLSLKIKKRQTEIRKLFPFAVWCAPTSNENRDNDFYATKDDTRVEGPWCDTDPYIPRQVREISSLRYWQLQIIESAKVWDTRTINVVIDSIGGHGKTTLKTYIGCHQIGRALPFMNDYRDLLRIVMDTPKRPLYVIDIPRALKKDHLFQFFSGIETLKDGYAFDDRYSFREEYFDCPSVWVFMNTEPDISYLSTDRWKFWQFSEKHNLKEYTPEGLRATASGTNLLCYNKS